MSSDLTRWLASTPIERESNRAIDRVQAITQVTQAKVAGVTQVAQSALLGALALGMTKREAALLIPEDAAKYDLIATTAVLTMAAQVQQLGGL